MRDAIFNPDGEEEAEGNPFLAPEDPNPRGAFGQPPPPPRRRPEGRRPVPPTVIGAGIMYEDGSEFVRGGYNMAQAHAMQQGAHLAGMANQVQNVLSDENDSRVAQMREIRRMEHEKEMLRMQAEARRKEQEGEMIRQILASM